MTYRSETDESTTEPLWQLPAPEAREYVAQHAKYHCFVVGTSLCGQYNQDTDYYDLGIESGEILANPHIACKKCREKWLRKYRLEHMCPTILANDGAPSGAESEVNPDVGNS